MAGSAIGSNPSGPTVAYNYMDVLNFLSGTLENVSQLNNGTTPLVKNGPGILILSGINSYTAGTIVSNGTLAVDQDGALGPGTLVLSPGVAPVALNFVGTPNVISGLSFDGGATFQAAGTWGSSSSGATHQDNTHFSGTGTVVVPASSSVGLTSSANPAGYGQPVVFTANVSGGDGTPTGTVTFYNGAAIMGSGTLNGSGLTTYTNSALPIGTNTITADYSGDSNYGAATSSALMQKVIVVPIALSGNSLVLQYGNSIVGTNYVLVSSPSLTPPITWTPVLTNAGTGGTLIFTVPFSSGTNQFFGYLLQ
jgi:autotransporter-associated beta strand protein